MNNENNLINPTPNNNQNSGINSNNNNSSNINQKSNIESLNNAPNSSSPTTFKIGSFSNVNIPSSNEPEVLNSIPKLEEQPPIEMLDPLNNANNPIPVNPTSPKIIKKDYSDIEFKLKDFFKELKQYIRKPLNNMDSIVEKYQYYMNALKITFILTFFGLILNFVFSSLSSIFTKTYNISSGSYHISLDFSQMFNQDWLTLVISNIFTSLVLTLIITLTYYLFSFIKNKGLTFGKILIITNMSLISLLLGISVAAPIGNIISKQISLILVGTSLIHSFLVFTSTMKHELKFNTDDQELLYNTILLGIVFLIFVCLVYLYYINIYQ